MPSDAQKRATERHQREKAKQQTVKSYPANADLREHPQEQSNKTGYIKDLTGTDVEKEGRAMARSPSSTARVRSRSAPSAAARRCPSRTSHSMSMPSSPPRRKCDAIPDEIEVRDMAFASAADGFFDLSHKGDGVTPLPSLYTRHETMTRIGFGQIAAEEGIKVAEAQEKLVAAERAAGLYGYPFPCSKVTETARRARAIHGTAHSDL